MEIVKLPAGIVAPPEADCIRVQESPDGSFQLGGSLLHTSDEDEAADESVCLVSIDPYPSYEAAEAAGLAWAAGCGVAVLHVARSNGTTPLPDPA